MGRCRKRIIFRDNRRIRSALKFNNVTEVKSKNIDKTQAEKALEFLTIDTVNNEQNITIKLIFSGGGQLW